MPTPPLGSRVLLLDHFDSFTFNVLHGLVEAGGSVEVRRVDAMGVDDIAAWDPSLLVLSPGPGRPEEATLALAAIHRFGGRIPILGICLGLQAIAVAYGGAVGRAPEPVHGKVSTVHHTGEGLFHGVASPMAVGRYHSLCVTRLPESLDVSARTGDGIVMGLRHREIPIAGVQFHPDSFLTLHGTEVLRNALHGRL